MRHAGKTFKVRHVELRIADRFGINGFRARGNRFLKGREIVGRDEFDGDTQPGECVVKKVVRAAVEVVRRDDLVACLRDIQQRQRDGRLAAGDRQGPDAAVDGGDALLQHVGGRVHQAGVDVAELLQAEEIGGVLGVLELV